MSVSELLSDTAVQQLVTAIGRKDRRMREHAERVAALASSIAAAMKVGDDTVRSIALGGLLHEIGKLDVPDAILFKPAKLNEDEMRVMRTYPSLGYERVRGIPSLASAAEIMYSHREKFDGSGYPRGLQGDAIPLGARMVAVACVACAFIADRPHDGAGALSFARAEISRWSGTAFDPGLVEIILSLPAEVMIPAVMKTAAP